LICATGFQGGLGTQVVKVFDRVAARTGLRDLEAIEAGFDPLTVSLTSWDHKVYYPGAKELHIRLTGDRCNGRLLGAQLVGHRKSEVSKRVDIFATALFHGMCVAELCDLDLSYYSATVVSLGPGSKKQDTGSGRFTAVGYPQGVLCKGRYHRRRISRNSEGPSTVLLISNRFVSDHRVDEKNG